MEKLKKVVLALIECFSAILEIEAPTLEFVKPDVEFCKKHDFDIVSYDEIDWT